MSTGLIGIGYWGKNLARNFFQLGSLRAICDSNPKALSIFERIYPDLIFTTQFTELLEDPTISQIVISTPATTHYALTKQALLSGKDVFVEKPCCLCSKELKELIKIATQKGCILMVGHIFHYHTAIMGVKKIVDDNILGDLLSIKTQRFQSEPRRLPENALWDLGSHDISLILSLCHQKSPEKMVCHGTDESAHIEMQFSDGLSAAIEVGYQCPSKEHRLIVQGSKGEAIFDEAKGWGEKLLVSNGEMHAIELEPIEPLKKECETFLYSCRTRENPLTEGNESLPVIRILEEAEHLINASSSDPEKKVSLAI